MLKCTHYIRLLIVAIILLFQGFSNAQDTIIVHLPDTNIYATDSINFLSDTIYSLPDSVSYTLDSTTIIPDSMSVHYFLEQGFIDHTFNLYPADTSLTYFQKFNPVKKPGEYYADLGSIGLAAKNLLFSPSPDFGFNLGVHTFDKFLYKHDNIPHFVTPKPFSEIFYVLGRYREQFFNIELTQRIGKNLHLGTKFSVLGAYGDFQRQQANNNRVYVDLSYFTKNKRYGLLTSFAANSIIVEENGGIISDSLFEQSTEEDTKRIPVWLLEAENRYKEASLSFNQYYVLSKRGLNETDSTPIKNIHKVFSPGKISHSLLYVSDKLIYTDNNPDSSFYPAIYFDSTRTYDETRFRKLENTFSWTNSIHQTSPLTLVLSFKYGFYVYNDSVHTIDSSLLNKDVYEYRLQQATYKGGIYIRPIKTLTLYGEAQLINGDYNNGDHRFFANAVNDFFYQTDNETRLELSVLYSRQAPSWIYQHYFSNHFIWENNFDRTGVFNTMVGVSWKKLQLKFNHFIMSDYVFFGTDTLPQQATKDINIMNGIVHYYSHFHKFDLDIGAVYHFVSDPEIIKIPKIMGTLSMYFNQDLFKGALQTQLGFDLYYNRKYYGDAYMPALRSFYLQNQKELDHLLVADIVFKFQVKKARFFLKYIHINSLIGSRDYYRILHYPIQEASFKFGISWMFHN